MYPNHIWVQDNYSMPVTAMEWKTIWIIGIGLMALLGSAMGMDDARGASIAGSGLPPSYIFSGCDTLAQVNASGSIIVSASSIDSLAMRSGKLFAGGSNGVLSVIDIESKTWENVTTSSSINSIAVLPNGKNIAVGGSDGVVRVLDIASLALVRTLAHGATNVWSVTAYGDHLVSGGGDKRIVSWNASTGAQELDVKASSSVRALAVGSNGTIAVGLYNGEISLLNPVSRNLTKLYSHTSITRSLAWSDDGSMLASVSSDKTLKIWGQNGSVVTVNAGTSGVYGVAWSGEHIITAGTDEHVRVWSANGSKERDFKIGSSVHSLASEGSSFAAGDLKGRVTLFSDTEPPSLVSSNAQYSNTNSTSIDFNGAFDECVSVDGASVSPT